MKKIVLTGGGTAGHVTPNLALVPGLKEMGYDILYIGSKEGMEKQIIEDAGIRYEGISTGKFRRYFSMENVTDIVKINRGIAEARNILKEYKPDVIFSKGGYVSVPVVQSGARLHIPVISHESDMTPGLANKLNMHATARICCNFPETLQYLPKGKGMVTGCPIRQELLEGDAEAGRRLSGLTGDKPILMVMGGSLGSVAVNNAVKKVLPTLLEDFQVIHICGKKNVDESMNGIPGYAQYGYVSEELKDFFAMTDLVVSRAGANAICELVALKKPNLLIPLSAAASRGDQILNAKSFAKQGFSKVLEEEEITDEILLSTIYELWSEREKYIYAMESSSQAGAVAAILKLIDEYTLIN